jgi:hypothetical protein
VVYAGRVLWGLDSAWPPRDDDHAAYAFSLGWRFYAGYLGGEALHIWQPQDWRRLARVGFKLLPIWVAPLELSGNVRQRGVDEGNAVLDLMHLWGLTGGLALDVENGAAPLEYSAGFLDAIHAGSAQVTLYGTNLTLDAMGSALPWDHWWLAMWSISDSPLAPAPKDWEIWQYNPGPTCDYNVAVDSFPFAQLAGSS